MLTSSYTLGQLTLASRIVFLPMFSAYAGQDGIVNQQLLDHYERMAGSGAGLVVVECSAVGPDAMGELGIKLYGQDTLPGLKQLAKCIQSQGAKAFIQLQHAGRFLPAGKACGPSAVEAFGVVPEELSIEDIGSITSQFVQAALLAQEAGFDGIELHGATGYLLSSFLSPRTNKRHDTYGGSLDNRMRFPLEVAAAVRKAVGDYPVGYRFLSQEVCPGGLTLEDSVAYAKVLAEVLQPVYLSVAAGTHECFALLAEQKVKPQEGFMVPDAVAVKKVVPHVPVIAAGHLQIPEKCEALLQEQKIDLVGLARVLLADPEWLHKVQKGKASEIRECILCNGCLRQIVKGQPMYCTRWTKEEKKHFLLHASSRG